MYFHEVRSSLENQMETMTSRLLPAVDTALHCPKRQPNTCFISNYNLHTTCSAPKDPAANLQLSAHCQAAGITREIGRTRSANEPSSVEARDWVSTPETLVGHSRPDRSVGLPTLLLLATNTLRTATSGTGHAN